MRARFFSAFCGLVYGCALSRLLFELDPTRLAFWATLPGIALTTLMVGGGWLWLTMRFPRLGPCSAALLIAGVALFPADTNPLRTLAFFLGATGMAGLLIIQRPTQNTQHPLRDTLYPLLLFILTFALYLRTLAPAVGEADAFEFQVGIARLGIAHGSGYPLLMLVGKVFSWLPVGGTLAFRANLTSAFFGSVSTVLVYAVGRKLGVAPLASTLAAFAFGVSPTLWSRTVEVEAYTLNAAFVGAILYLCLHLTADDRTLATDGAQDMQCGARYAQRFPFILGLLFGLSLTNHLTSLLMAPIVALTLVRYVTRNRQHALRLTLLFLSAFLLGISVYLYLPLRWPAVNNGESLSWAQFANILTGSEAKGAFRPMLPFQDVSRYAIVFRKLAGEYGLIGIVLALFGFISLACGTKYTNRSTRYVTRNIFFHPAVILMLAFVPYLYFALAFTVGDPDFSAFLVPLYLVIAVLMGVGLNTMLNTRYATRNPRYAPCLTSIVYAAFCVIPLSAIPAVLPRVDHSTDWRAYEWGKLALSYPLAPNATVLADSDKIAPLYYLKVVEGVRPDLDPVVLPNESTYRFELDRRLASGQTVYLARFLPGLGAFYSLRSVGPLVQVSPAPFRSQLPTSNPPILRASTLSLIQVDAPSTVHAGESLALTLYWHATAPADANYLVNFRLRSGRGIAWKSAGSVPVGGLYPTNAWRPDETLSDFYALSLDAPVPPGNYTLEIGLFPPFTVTDSGWTPIMPLAVLAPRALPAPETHLAIRLASAWVVGYSAPESATPGARLSLTLYVRRDPAAAQFATLGETRDLTPWPADTTIPVRYTVTLPTTGTQQTLELEGAEICGWRVVQGRVCRLTTIKLVGESIAENAANFDGQLLLRAATLGQATARPGDVVRVSLEWQGLQSIAENYTVFVHLVGPDGRLHGQVDEWPVSGTRATSTWEPGEIIHDEYAVPLAPDAPAGPYEVHVGLYLLATLRRVPVLNTESVPIDDKAVVRGLSVTR